jgi:hypothetical protein
MCVKRGIGVGVTRASNKPVGFSKGRASAVLEFLLRRSIFLVLFIFCTSREEEEEER